MHCPEDSSSSKKNAVLREFVSKVGFGTDVMTLLMTACNAASGSAEGSGLQ